MKPTPMMQCGHAANATYGDNKPACVICVGIHAGAKIIAETPDFSNRKSKCNICKKETPSSQELPFFESKPTEDYDGHYCGCMGWN